jgi:hypothetical protein
MALDRHKLENVSYNGFNVENLEAIEDQLRQCLHALHKGRATQAVAIARVIESRSASLLQQCINLETRIKERFDAIAK